MDIKKLAKYLIIIIVLGSGFIIIYKNISPSKDFSENGSQVDTSQPAAVDVRTLKLIEGLDISIFDDPKFKLLKESTTIREKSIKRGNKNIFKSD